MGLFTGMFATAKHPTDVAFRTKDGMVVTHSGDAWLWRTLPQTPLSFEDQPARLQVEQRWHTMLSELGETSHAGVAQSKWGAYHREIHVVSLLWDYIAKPSPDSTQDLQEWLSQILSTFSSSDGLVAIGVKLKPKALFGATTKKGKNYWQRQFKRWLAKFVTAKPDVQLWGADKSLISPLLARAGGEIPSDVEFDRLTHWWNGGRAADAKIIAEPSGQVLSTGAWPEGLVFSAMIDAEERIINPDLGLWIADAFSHRQGCVALSVRAELWRSSQIRALARKSQRRSLEQIREQAETGDIEREEDEEQREGGELIEEVARSGGEPFLVNTSIITAHREAVGAYETFAHTLQQRYGLIFKPVEYRQVEALRSMLPGGYNAFHSKKPFAQILSLGLLSQSGIGNFPIIGDSTGVWMGLALHEMSPVWLDPRGSSKGDKPPAMVVIGEPGSGKTFFLQLLATQTALSEESVVFINPKPADSLVDFANAIGGETITISASPEQNGMLDPFRFASPQDAADIAHSHILGVLSEMTEEEEVQLNAALTQAALEGAQCVGDALKHADVPQRVANLVRQQCAGSALFALGVSDVPLPPLGMGDTKGSLTLVEFERALHLPVQTAASVREYERDTRIGLATLRLVARASMEQMLRSGGGMLIIDEAHVFLGSNEGRNFLQRLGREGRSQGILPILATQRIADVMSEGTDMGSYLGRVMVMKMEDKDECDAALELLGLEANDERRNWLAKAGPIRANKEIPGRGSLGYFRDLDGRCAGILVGPVPPEIHTAFSTNPLDRQQPTAVGNVDE